MLTLPRCSGLSGKNVSLDAAVSYSLSCCMGFACSLWGCILWMPPLPSPLQPHRCVMYSAYDQHELLQGTATAHAVLTTVD